ncbi:MAG: transposase [Anaerolineae bacterium]
MERTQPQLISTSELAPDNGTNATPFSQQTVVLTKQAYIELKWEANYWRAQHARLVEREAALTAEVDTLQATIRDLKQRLYGTKSETSSGADGMVSPKPAPPRNRGQQPGSKGHGRRDRSALPVVAEVHDVSEEAKHCPTCGEAFRPFLGTEESDIIEVEVQAHIRRIRRKRYHKGCRCSQVAGIITAPPAPRLIPKSPLGVSVWTHVLLDTYLYGRPIHRLCEALRHHGLPLSQGTVTDGLHKIAALFAPLRPLLRARQMGEKLFHGDETRWEVCEEVEGKVGHRWSLWVMQSASVVDYRNHWDGLTVFVERPEVAMDNKSAERALRTPVVGRKTYDGSGCVWSAHLAAMMLSMLQTIVLWGLNPYHWLRVFLQACADHGGKSPTDLSSFLPWQMTPERRAALARPLTLAARGEPEAPTPPDTWLDWSLYPTSGRCLTGLTPIKPEGGRAALDGRCRTRIMYCRNV